ncbi:GTP-binding protein BRASSINAZOLE INSENSITIVE PALE GREEN 2, chloroplastic [Quillaja saponaria]|uniref:GTP-binding protein BRASSINAZOLE INSENSITIVE PALE GREEN 2, chloroplastic n=1 Tax=Quillaja saponaria TaxID=32244 RepID=A0AAD7Q881_QUISA|nr:GTP-binding protein BRASSINAZOLE INSENSITIVE PALE GREEN 2, chloroplastic [Quillaja saponaria]
MVILLSTIVSPSTATKVSFNFSCNNGKQKSPASRFGLLTGLNRYSSKHCEKIFMSSFAVNNQSIQKVTGKITPRKDGMNTLLSEGRDEDENYGPICPGCGVFMQDKDPNLPGYYRQRKEKVSEISDDEAVFSEFDVFDEDGNEGEEEREEEEGSLDGNEFKFEENDLALKDQFDWDSNEWEAKLLEEEDDNLESDGFAAPGIGYGNIKEETIEKAKKKKVSKANRKKKARDAKKVKDEVTVCARCHSLRNYGQVKNQTAENLIPDFDFDRLISTRMMKPTGSGSATVVVMVVDCVDFDGSFPKTAVKSLFKALEGIKDVPNLSRKLPKLVLVATKVDLLPSQISPTRLDRWVRHRARAGGAPKLSGVYLVSSHKDLGVRNLLSFIKKLAGPRGNVWVIGAQNAGKSTLINAFAKKEGAKVTKLTEAPVPGTTLGILRIGGILSAKTKMFDTPGLLHPYLISMRLDRDEQKMIEIRKELRPRTYRMKAVHVGGLMRLDLNEASVETIYVTIWASPNVSLHLGKIENADEIFRNHVGVRLQPPLGNHRAAEIGKWGEREVKVSGISWEVNSIDIAIAGLGWLSLGLKGEATLTLWTYDGLELTLREPLVLDRAHSLERSGFWLPKAISDAIGNQTKLEVQRKKLEENSTECLSEVSA